VEEVVEAENHQVVGDYLEVEEVDFLEAAEAGRSECQDQN
jgi:hypothetical protein